METLMALLFFVLFLGFIFFIGLLWCKIVKKTGYNGALGILMLVPVANIILMAILAFKDWPIQRETAGAQTKPASSLSTPVIVAIVIAALIPLLILLAAIAIPSFLKNKLLANEAYTEARVRKISTAIETYSLDKGQYPLSEEELKNNNYITEQYDKIEKAGYIYSLKLDQNGYEILAKPQACGTTGSKIFTSNNNAGFSEESCNN